MAGSVSAEENSHLIWRDVFLIVHALFQIFTIIPHINTRGGHSDAKSYGSSLELRRDPWINKFLVA